MNQDLNDKIWCVYMHTNKINNKVYVGQTCSRPERRWGKDGSGYKECPLFWRAIQKYGWDNFEHIIFDSNLTKMEANKIEILLIALYNTTDPNKGYNLTLGGEGTRPTEEVRQKMRDVTLKRLEKNEHPWKNRHHSEESKKKMSNSKKGKYTGKDNPNYGNHKMAGKNNPMYGNNRFSGENNPNYGKGNIVVQLTLDDQYILEYSNAKEAERQTGIRATNIYACCLNKPHCKTAGGFKWKYKKDMNINFEDIMEAI